MVLIDQLLDYSFCLFGEILLRGFGDESWRLEYEGKGENAKPHSCDVENVILNVSKN